MHTQVKRQFHLPLKRAYWEEVNIRPEILALTTAHGGWLNGAENRYSYICPTPPPTGRVSLYFHKEQLHDFTKKSKNVDRTSMLACLSIREPLSIGKGEMQTSGKETYIIEKGKKDDILYFKLVPEKMRKR